MTQPGFHSRSLESIVQGQQICDGTGVRLLRLLTHETQQRLDPFLLLDEFCLDDASDDISGFPDHPHRGFETVTYMLEGRMRHKDNIGNTGILRAGDVQWMTAGRGVIHAEIPECSERRLRGFQLWINLSARHKLCKPRYRDIPAARIPQRHSTAGNLIKIIAGHYGEQCGAMQRQITEPLYLDVELKAGSLEQLLIPPLHNALIYVYAGCVHINDGQYAVPARQMAILDTPPHSDGVSITAEEDSKLLLIAGKPLNEPIVQWGPFVMNSKAQIDEAIDDYRNDRFNREIA